MTPQKEYQAEHEEEWTEESHDESVFSEDARSVIVRGENVRLLRGSPQMFYDKLRKRLDGLGINLDALDSRTSPDDPPPCYSLARSDYTEWMRLAAVELVPIRYDLPGEPNYCHDCTPEFKGAAMKAGACMFPNTRFEVRRFEGGERETVGVSRSQSVPPESYVIYQEITVPIEALHAKLKNHVLKKPNKNKFARADFPEDVRNDFDRVRAPKVVKVIT